MRVTHLRTVHGTSRDVVTADWRSSRLLVAEDGLGYSLHDTTVRAGAELSMRYGNHIESVYLIDGSGELVDEATGERHPLSAGSVYVLDRHDRHTLRATTAIRAVCVFTPACVGTEVHDASGGYAVPA